MKDPSERGESTEHKTSYHENQTESTEDVSRKAKELGVDLSSIDGTGRDGSITEKDVEKASAYKKYRKLLAALAGPYEGRRDVVIPSLAPDEPAKWVVPEYDQPRRELEASGKPRSGSLIDEKRSKGEKSS